MILDPTTTRAEFEVEQPIPARFAQLVAAQPERIAIAAGAWQPTYLELDRASNGFAETLIAKGKVGDRIALLMRHDAPLLVSILAVLKAGRVVVVLNASDPINRLQQILEDAEPAIIVTDSFHREAAMQLAGKTRSVVLWEDRVSDQDSAPAIEINPADAAWLVYTSGSTGRPKGVIQTHRNILHNARRLTGGLGMQPSDRITLFASPSGGQGLATIWCAWTIGAAICPFPVMEKGVTGLAEWMTSHEISVLIASASLFRHFLRSVEPSVRFPAVRVVRLASESATAEDFAAFRKYFAPTCGLFNTLSSSETGNIFQHHFAWDAAGVVGRLPVGKPADGIEVLLVDGEGAEVINGGAGEIMVRSRYLSPGYWRNEALTAQRFSGDDVRTYKTGDLGSRSRDGLIEFKGRKDSQVKVRGYRIEISEVESALARQSGVERAVVNVQANSGENRLLAFVQMKSNHAPGIEELREGLSAILPTYMMPSGIFFVDGFPLTPHGKIDWEQLLKMAEQPAVPDVVVPPETETEKFVAGLWCEVFKIPSVSRTDDFISLGGDSLKAAIVGARIYAAYELELDLRVFNERSKLIALAELIDQRKKSSRADGLPPLVRISRAGPLPTSFAQERTWEISQTVAGSAAYTVAFSYLMRGPVNAEVLRESLDYLTRRHEILRTTFTEKDGQPVQIVHPAEPVKLDIRDFTKEPDPEKAASDFFRNEAKQVFFPREKPLLRYYLLRVRPDEHQFGRINHHIISDGWSWKVFFSELSQIYAAKLRGATPSIPDHEALQFGDYAAWQRKSLEADVAGYRASVKWWHKTLRRAPIFQYLPTRRAQPEPEAKTSDALIWWPMNAEVSRRLTEFGKTTGLTYFTVRLAAFAAQLAIESADRDVVIGMYVTHRTRVETQRMFGFFSNLVTLRLRFKPKLTFREWATEVGRMVGEVQVNRVIPYERLRKELAARKVELPAIQTIFSVTDQVPPTRFGDAEMTPLDRLMEIMPWGFTLAFDSTDETKRCRLSFDASTHEPAKVREWLNRYQRWIDVISREPHLRVGELAKCAGIKPLQQRLNWIQRLMKRKGKGSRVSPA